MGKTVIKTGSSGIEIQFYKDKNKNKVVRKKTTKSEQIDRLKTQFKKHLFLLKYSNNLFNIPEVLSHHESENGFYYEYRYIEGLSLDEVFMKKPKNEIIHIANKLLATIKFLSQQNSFFETTPQGKNLKEMLYQRIVKNSLFLKPILLNKITNKLNDFPFNNKKTMCHGDFSFENIIIDQKNNIWLIDFIGNFYPHYWLDIAKMFQEIEGEWLYIKKDIFLDKEKSQYLVDYLKREIALFDKDYFKYHNFLMSTVLLRSLPYLKNEPQRQKALKKIGEYLER